MEQFRYVVGVLLVVTVPPAVVPWYLVHPFHRFWRRVGPLWTWVVAGPLMFLGIYGLWTIRARLMGDDLGTHTEVVALGVVLYGVSLFFEVSARRHLSMRTLVGIPQLRGEAGPKALLQEGIYARVRHPRYVAVGIGIVSWALVANYSGVYLLLLVVLVALAGVTVLEERELVHRFGDRYRDYQSRVPRLIPRIRSGGER